MQLDCREIYENKKTFLTTQMHKNTFNGVVKLFMDKLKAFLI